MQCSIFNKLLRTRFIYSFFYAAGIMLLAGGCNTSPQTDPGFFNGTSLDGWSASDSSYWLVQEGAIVGHSAHEVKRNEFLWSNTEVTDFYLSVDVKLEPNGGNAGIQFRSKKLDESGQAAGYQADVGKAVWGRLYHEHDRTYIDWPDEGEKAVRPGDWNHYEILASGNRIWTAINGVLSVAVEDPFGEKKGRIAVQMHSGPPITVHYRFNKLVHHPKIELAGFNEKQLEEKLRTPLNIPDGKALGNRKLELKDNDVVVFTGATNMANFRKSGYLETLLIAANPGKALHFRNMAWEGDVAAEQYRETGFGGWESNLDSVRCNVLFVQFGQMESIQGEDSLPGFINNYKRLLDSARKGGRQIVVVSPVPFEAKALKLSGNRAESIPVVQAPVDKYAGAIKQMAAEEGYVYVDLFRQMKVHSLSERYTTDGIRLTAKAQQLAATLIMKELNLPSVYKAAYEPLRKQVQSMNSLWFQYWRAGNWAFIYGSELVQPFSRDWKDRNHRILPEERTALESYLKKAEQHIREESDKL
ncbi:family 16 glycoside hydrolase [Agriterribacter humi]|uniref:family 16 glycoside hydrolase n=1 Tax=Agriterribacter humi TaxID=1104781 RepID=UPI0012646793|nr:family 16 glycoside hydrolase [Agriterribacter humi]